MKIWGDVTVRVSSACCETTFRIFNTNVQARHSAFLYARSLERFLIIVNKMQKFYDISKNLTKDPLEWLTNMLTMTGIVFSVENRIITVEYDTWIMVLGNFLK